MSEALRSTVLAYKAQVERYAEALLRPYLDRMRQPGWSPPDPKEINDPVWQTILLSPFEVILLDSPLLQRLRHIRQLGVVHWTYPGANHSRLEHSLGALHQVQRLLDSVATYSTFNAEVHSSPRVTLEGKWVNLLRLCALCHDVGHGLMSHVVENALDALGVLAELQLDLADMFNKERVSLSEAAAYFILESRAFRELADFAKSRTNHDLPLDYLDLLRKAIVGNPIHSRYPFLHELISGPFDVDKLDYMSRDARMTGIPIVTDIPRLIQKIRVVELRHDQLPTEVLKVLTASQPTYFFHAVALSGARTLDELMLGRTLLFDKVYRHQKVRATEAMVTSIVTEIASVAGDQLAILPLLFKDDDIFSLTRERLRDTLQIALPEWPAEPIVQDLTRRLAERQLFVRAYAFSHNMPDDPFRTDPVQRHGLEDLQRKARQPEHRRHLLDDIIQTVKTMRERVPDQIAPAIRSEHLHHYIALDPPASPSQTSEIARAYLLNSEGRLMRFRDDSAESSAWSNAYLMTRDLGYVFTAQELAPAVFLACEAVLRQKNGIRTPKSVHYYAKTPISRTEALRKALTEQGFYDELPLDLRAEPARLSRPDAQAEIRQLAQKFSSFEGLATDEKRSHAVKVDETRLLSWLRQFRNDEEVDAALRLLSATKVIGRSDLHAALREFMQRYPQFRGAYVCPLGGPKDSSSVLTYYAQDVYDEFEVKSVSLLEALNAPRKPILFVDDLIGSGGQSVTVLLEWLDRREETPLEESHVEPLSAANLAELKQRAVGFLFICGESAGVQRLEEVAHQEGFNATVHASLMDDRLPKAFDSSHVTFHSPEKAEAFRRRCEEIGKQLLRNYGHKARSEDWVTQRALGYGNNAYLIVFPYNTPTQTLTLLWCDGKVGHWDWLPLFPRRKKT